MRIVFSMDAIKDMDLLYAWTMEPSEEFGEIRTEHYHGDSYCMAVIADVLGALAPSEWKTQEYLGARGRIANEIFTLLSTTGFEYSISFAINTYKGEAARMEININAPEIGSYDQRLENLKIVLKNRLISDWHVCTWLMLFS